jgi:hypothetical protein
MTSVILPLRDITSLILYTSPWPKETGDNKYSAHQHGWPGTVLVIINAHTDKQEPQGPA